MSNQVEWIKLSTTLFEDEKILEIMSLKNGNNIILLWIRIMCLAGKLNQDGMLLDSVGKPYTSERLSVLFRVKKTLLDLSINTFKEYGMIEENDGILEITNWCKYQSLEGLEKIKEQNRLRAKKYRDGKKDNVKSRDSVTLNHVMPLKDNNISKSNSNNKYISKRNIKESEKPDWLKDYEQHFEEKVNDL